jgi:cyclase
LKRRTFLRAALLGGGGALIWPHVAPAQFPPAPGPVPLSDSLVQISGAGGNVVALATPEGAVMVDGGSAKHSAEVLRLVLTGTRTSKVHTLFNTHWHYDQTGSNEALGKSRTRILAHENTKLWLGGDFYVEWQDRYYKPRPREALPTETFYTGGEMKLGDEVIQYGHLPRAHTDGDIYVYFLKANILVVGDVLSVGEYPVLDYSTGGWIGGMIAANATLLKLANERTRIVAGQGPVQTRADLQAQHDMLVAVKDRLVPLMKQGMSPQDMLDAAATKGFDTKWGDPKQFVANAYRGMWGHVFFLGAGII